MDAVLTSTAVPFVSARHDGVDLLVIAFTDVAIIGFIRLRIDHVIGFIHAIGFTHVAVIILVGEVAASTLRRANLALP
jgi:hypothetical protein